MTAFPIDAPEPPSHLARDIEWMRWAGRTHRELTETVLTPSRGPGHFSTGPLQWHARSASADAAHLMGQARMVLAEYDARPTSQGHLLNAWHGWRRELI